MSDKSINPLGGDKTEFAISESSSKNADLSMYI